MADDPLKAAQEAAQHAWKKSKHEPELCPVCSVRAQCLDDLDWTISEAQHTYRGQVSVEQKIELLQTVLLATVNRARLLMRLIV